MSADLAPGDADDPKGSPLLLFSNEDCRISLSPRSEPMPFFVRDIDGDLLLFVHTGIGRLATEFGAMPYRPGDWMYLPKACTWRQIPDKQTTVLMIQATDEFEVAKSGPLDRHFAFDPSQCDDPRAATARLRPRQLRNPDGPQRRGDDTVLSQPSVGRRGLAW